MTDDSEQFTHFPNRIEMLIQNYYYESPYYMIENPRTLDNYFSLLELELVRRGYNILISEKAIGSRKEFKSVPFVGVIKASTVFKAKEVEREVPNIVLMLFSIIAILYAIITVFFIPTLGIVLPLLLVYIIVAGISLFLYIKALRQKGKFGLSIYNSQTFLMIEIITTGLGILISLIGIIILVIRAIIPYALLIPLTALIVLSLGAIIGRCFFEFRVKRTFYPTLEKSPAFLYIRFQGIIHQKLLEQSLPETNVAKKKSVIDQEEVAYLTYIKEIDKLELKFMYSYDFTEELPDEAEQIINEIKQIIVSTLNSKPVELPKIAVKDQSIEAPLISNRKPREFPINPLE